MTRAFLALGSNLGDRAAHLQAAVNFLHTEADLTVRAVSPVYETDPVGGPVQDDFLNAVIEIETECSPRQLLEIAHAAEAAADRVRVERWGPRTLDVDIVFIDGVTVDEPDLTIPHPRWRERDFVLAPMHDVAPDAVEVPGGGWHGVRRTAVTLMMPA
ncbi:MAG: 2-amino-4-hydroxy-6-hydroxymethyldihydropteridine diphosphokinase [Acidimicrobiia bacterium]